MKTYTFNDTQLSIFKAFVKFYGMDQEGQNDYAVGCIQTANALMPIVSGLLLQSGRETIEQFK